MLGELFEILNNSLASGQRQTFVRQRGAGGMTTQLTWPLNGVLPPTQSTDALTDVKTQLCPK
jgi:hypothetical protein